MLAGLKLAEPRLTAWPPLPPLVYLRKPLRELPFPLGAPEATLFAWGRQALWHGLRALGLQAGDEVLMPAYHHGSEVEVVIRLGLVPVFYDLDDRLRPRPEELEGLISPRTRALHLIHYFGFPQDAPGWRRWCDEHGLLLIEDAAQAWLAFAGDRPVGSFGDLAFFCLYKMIGLPEGAVAVCSRPLAKRPLDRRPGAVELARKHGLWVAGRSRLMAAAASAVRSSPALRDEFELRDPASMPWRTTSFLLRRAAQPGVAERRRSNYQVLLAALRERTRPPYDDVPGHASPFAFPVTVRDKAATLQSLRAANVRALDAWSVAHPALPEAYFPEANTRRASTLALPVHQELRPPDLERIVATLERGDPH
jgi:dTDP-4-amino-4,6-dideoxygalactose transaminase